MIKHEKEVDKMKKIIGLLEWNLKDFIKMIIGSLMFCIAVNIFIVPNELYTGGLLGISQLIRSIIIDVIVEQNGNIKKLILEEKRGRRFTKEEYEILWSQIVKIGDDIILIDTRNK